MSETAGIWSLRSSVAHVELLERTEVVGVGYVGDSDRTVHSSSQLRKS
jgi:hypothetical protein